MPRYNVVLVNGRKNEPVKDADGNPVEWDCPLKAADRAQAWTAHHYPRKYQVREVVEDDNWKQREQERLENGHYTKLPWHNEPWVKLAAECEHHYPHVARKDQVNIAFTVDDRQGVRDLHTAIRPSKYLARYYSKHLTEAQIREYVANYKKLYDKERIILFATEAKDIVRVYKNGPHSCMANPAHKSKIHPVEAYAGPDLAIAYLQKQKTIYARVLCWPNKKEYGRPYGDVTLLKTLLDEEGWRQTNLEGARLTKIIQGHRIICPFIDGARMVRVENDYLYIDSRGNRVAANQDGFCGQGYRCASCHEEYDLHEYAPINVDNVNLCKVCFSKSKDSMNIFECSFNNRWYNNQNKMIETFDGQLIYRGWVNYDHYFKCDECEKIYPQRAYDGNRLYQSKERPYLPVHFLEYNYSWGRNVAKCNLCVTRQGEMFAGVKLK